MSCMLCKLCERLVDTDDDPDSLYVIRYDGECVCKWCREDGRLKTEFDERD